MTPPLAKTAKQAKNPACGTLFPRRPCAISRRPHMFGCGSETPRAEQAKMSALSRMTHAAYLETLCDCSRHHRTRRQIPADRGRNQRRHPHQPAGHLDPYESLEQAVIRETLEETAHDFTPTALVGMYMSRYTSNRTGEEVTYLRFTFCGVPGKEHDQPLDEGILRTLWLTRDELAACQERHRSPIVLQCVDEYLAGRRAPLELLHTHASVFKEAPTTRFG